MSMSVEWKWIDQPGNPERIQLLSNLSDCMHQNTKGVEDMEEATPIGWVRGLPIGLEGPGRGEGRVRVRCTFEA